MTDDKDSGRDKKLEILKKNADDFVGFFEKNRKRYKKSMLFAFKETLSDEDRAKLEDLQRPILEVNYIQAYLSRMIGEASKQMPEPKVSGVPSGIGQDGSFNYLPNQVNTTEFIESAYREIFLRYQQEGYANALLKEQYGGGYSVMVVNADYRNNKSFDMQISLKKGDDPTLYFFDPLAKKNTKVDGKYCGRFIPMLKKDAKEQYPKHAEKIEQLKPSSTSQSDTIEWYYKNGKKDIVMIAECYCVEYKRKRMALLSDGSSVPQTEYNKVFKDSPMPDLLPTVVKVRTVKDPFIKRYVYVANEILEEETTSLPGLPFIFVDGNSAFVYRTSESKEVEQVVNSYIWSSIDVQKFLNVTVQSIANYSENYMPTKMIWDERAIVDAESLKTPQKYQTLLKRSVDERGEIPSPIIPMQQQDLPASIMSTFGSMQNVMQNTFGSYDAMLGINKQDLSGIAIQEGATQNNAVAMPFINSLNDAVNAAADLILKMIPIYYATPMTVPVIDCEGSRSYKSINQIMPDGSPDPNSIQMDFDENDLHVEVSAGYNFEIQKDKSLKMLSDLMKTFPSMAQSIDQYGQDVILDNINIRGVDKLKEILKQADAQKQQAQQQQGQQPNPAMIEMQLKQQELQLKMSQMQQDADYKNKKLMLDNQKLQSDLEIERLKLAQAQARGDAEIQNSAIDNAGKLAGHQLKQDDQHHRHAIELMNLMGGAA